MKNYFLCEKHEHFVLKKLNFYLFRKIWAAGKHRNYKKEFPNYPKGRTPIVPFLC